MAICYASHLESPKKIATVCRSLVSRTSDLWTTAARAATCGRCRRTKAYRERVSAGGIAVDGDAPPGHITQIGHFGARERHIFARHRAAFYAYLGEPT